MSQENVEVVRKANDAFRRGDWVTMEANADPHVVVRADSSWPEQYIYGRDAVMAWYRSGWESLGPDVRVEEIIDLGDRVLVRNCWTVQGQHSGLGGDLRWSEIVTYRQGRSVSSRCSLTMHKPSKPWGWRSRHPTSPGRAR